MIARVIGESNLAAAIHCVSLTDDSPTYKNIFNALCTLTDRKYKIQHIPNMK